MQYPDSQVDLSEVALSAYRTAAPGVTRYCSSNVDKDVTFDDGWAERCDVVGSSNVGARTLVRVEEVQLDISIWPA